MAPEREGVIRCLEELGAHLTVEAHRAEHVLELPRIVVMIERPSRVHAEQLDPASEYVAQLARNFGLRRERPRRRVDRPLPGRPDGPSPEPTHQPEHLVPPGARAKEARSVMPDVE